MLATYNPSMQAKTSAAPAAFDYRRALGQFATGVTVITTRATDGMPVGVTANSFNSVSLEPPLVLWSLSRSAQSFEAFRQCPRYRIHVLAADQLDLARRFATRGADKFDGAPWHWTDAPPAAAADDRLPALTQGHVAWFECVHHNLHAEGDHMILVGRVTAYQHAGGAPLIFHDSRYITELTEALLPRGLSTPVR
jgi:flavin reductase (DIM6/NTAB) family NADH-FMN oxidoreductase RutF